MQRKHIIPEFILAKSFKGSWCIGYPSRPLHFLTLHAFYMHACSHTFLFSSMWPTHSHAHVLAIHYVYIHSSLWWDWLSYLLGIYSLLFFLSCAPLQRGGYRVPRRREVEPYPNQEPSSIRFMESQYTCHSGMETPYEKN